MSIVQEVILWIRTMYHIIITDKNQKNKIMSSTQTFNRTGWKQQNKMFNDRSYEKVKTHIEENCR